jgi:hypothetical protein
MLASPWLLAWCAKESPEPGAGQAKPLSYARWCGADGACFAVGLIDDRHRRFRGADLEKLRQLLGRRDGVSSGILAALVLTVALHQFLTSAGGVLTPWKGGGFGMYTTPHGVDSRATFLVIDGKALRLAPPDPAFTAWVAEGDPAARAYMERLQAAADRLRPYPRAAEAGAVMAQAARVVWDGDLFDAWGDVGPSPVADMAVTVVEIARRPSAGVIETRVVFTHAGN